MDISNPSEKSSSIIPLSFISNQQKIKRLKLLQELENRKFQLNYNRLIKEQNKIYKQLDIQRLQFTRRLSETNFILDDSSKLDNIDSKKIKQPSIQNDDHGNSDHRLHSQDNIHEKDHLNQPFWLRLRSLGVPSDEDILLSALTCKNMNINDKLESDVIDEDDVFESNSKSSIIKNSKNIQKQRSSSVTGADEFYKNLSKPHNNNHNHPIKRIKRSLSLEEQKPNWLLTLNQLKREKLLRNHSNTQEEITALLAYFTNDGLGSNIENNQ
ncbi:hypothetical protein Smp_137810 [Schistosoma mansoni]|uniref:hypothetical protein n=1 Tax=Schistosoma mansoni TaxID=6183 RepID=UPI0001A63A35|nr:hypothetical protein Smp_137810 [Schistosoma mansoni]|eukprot:XP_018650813.1 hypothetical protein Smp_137810 [Schistosoma mansoni]